MDHRTLFAALLTGAALLAAAPRASAQDAPPPGPAPAPAAAETEAARAERLARARARWDALSPGERDRLLRSYEEWKRYSEEKRDALRRRLEEVGGREGADLVGSRLEEMRRKAPERLAKMRMQSATLERLVDRLVRGAPERARTAFEALSPEAQERVRHRLGHSLIGLGREAMLQRHATAGEKAALETATPGRKAEIVRAVTQRVAEEVLAPHREELAALSEAERRARKAALLEESFWQGVRERGEEIRGALGRVMQESVGNGHRAGTEMKNRFHHAFGVTVEELGEPRAARALVRAAAVLPEAEREAFFEKVRPEIRRIRGLPAAERAPALRDLLQSLRK